VIIGLQESAKLDDFNRDQKAVTIHLIGALAVRKSSTPLLPKECIFCGAWENLTGEHVFAEWLAPYLPKIGRTGHTATKTLRVLDASSLKVIRDTHFARKGTLHKRGPLKNQTLKIVCARCNTGWMSMLQGQVKPILLPILEGGWPGEIAAWERRILAAWAAMFTMVVEFSDLDTQVTPFEDRERLRLTLEPPDGWYIWIGLHAGPLWTSGFNHFAWPSIPKVYSKGQIDKAYKNDVQSTGWLVGPAFFQTISAGVPGYPVDRFAFAIRHGLRVVWPSDKLPIERPVRVMDDIAADNVTVGHLPHFYPRKTLRKAWETM